jgi:hypothetical protein
MDNMYMHLTNYAINKFSKAFKQNNTVEDDHCGSKRSLKFILSYLKLNFDADTNKLMN